MAAEASQIQTGYEDLQTFHDWIEQTNVLQTSLDNHPGGYNIIHHILDDEALLEAQLDVVRASNSEFAARKRLALEVADRSYDGLDVIAKLAALNGLSRFSRRGNHPPLAVDLSHREQPSGVRSYLETAKAINSVDGALRQVDERLKDKSTVAVHENHRRPRYDDPDKEVSVWFDPGDESKPDGVVDTDYTIEGMVEERRRSFMLWHPVIENDGTITYQIPMSIDRVREITTQRHAPKGFMAIRFIKSENDGNFSAPLLSVRQAAGVRIDGYHSRIYEEYGNTMEITIDGVLLGEKTEEQEKS